MDRKQSNYDPAELSDQYGQGNFYRNYLWSINPFLTIRELLVKTGEELDRFRRCVVPWQRCEMKSNLYLFACSMSCTADDFLSRRAWHIAPLEKVVPRLGRLVGFAENAMNFPVQLRQSINLRWMREWKEQLDRFVEMTCMLVLRDDVNSSTDTEGLELAFERIQGPNLPPDFLEARMRLNEGYACQDLHCDDLLTLAERFLETNPDREARYVVVGARTAGSYFAPLIKVCLQANGLPNVEWITLRPRYGAHGTEGKRLKQLLRGDVKVLLSDDYSNTGRTLRMLEKCVLNCGVDPENVTALVPSHPSADVDLSDVLAKDSSGVRRLITIGLGELHVAKALEPLSIGRIVSDILTESGVRAVSVIESEWSCEVNRTLWSHYDESFQARLKRVYELSMTNGDGSEIRKRIIAKSVGFGWLGYHAYIAGRALDGFVPEVLGLREGILIMEWIEGTPLTDSDVTDEVIEEMSAYLARRRETLGLTEDPKGNIPYLGWGWLEILSVLRNVYNRLLGYMKYQVLLENLKRTLRFRPTLIDGRMRPGEWIRSDNRLVKVDFEQHCFGAPELDFVDPAYDIAATVFEFHLNEALEERMVASYCNRSGDAETLRDRIFIGKLLYATSEAERALHRIVKDCGSGDRYVLNERLLHSWNFRVYAMNKFASSFLRIVEPGGRNSGLFFMDLDGVFDSEIMGFPHTTASGLEAISLLKSAGYNVILNTGRSVEHVRDYCRNFGFAGGIAEYGSVIVNPVTFTELPLVDDDTLDELKRCKEVLSTIGGIYTDSGYHCAIRAFRYAPGGAKGLTPEEAAEFLERNEFNLIKMISRKPDTYFVGRNVDKGSAMAPMIILSGFSGDHIAAIGDSDEDLPMLKRARYSYAPSNCSKGIRRLERKLGCTILPGTGPAGLLDAVATLLRLDSYTPLKKFTTSYPPDSLRELMFQLLTIADYPLHKRLLSVVKRKDLQ